MGTGLITWSPISLGLCSGKWSAVEVYENEDYESEGDEEFNFLDLNYDSLNVGEAVSIMFNPEVNQSTDNQVHPIPPLIKTR